MEVREALKIFGIPRIEELDKTKLRYTYRELMKRYHPDVTDGYEDTVAMINEAMSILKNVDLSNVKLDYKMASCINVVDVEKLFNGEKVYRGGEEINLDRCVCSIDVEVSDGETSENITAFGVPKKQRFEEQVNIEVDVGVSDSTLGVDVTVCVNNKETRQIRLGTGMVLLPVRISEKVLLELRIYRVCFKR